MCRSCGRLCVERLISFNADCPNRGRDYSDQLNGLATCLRLSKSSWIFFFFFFLLRDIKSCMSTKLLVAFETSKVYKYKVEQIITEIFFPPTLSSNSFSNLYFPYSNLLNSWEIMVSLKPSCNSKASLGSHSFLTSTCRSNYLISYFLLTVFTGMRFYLAKLCKSLSLRSIRSTTAGCSMLLGEIYQC